MASPMPSSARLPAELTDSIIDFLHSDRPALASCSLVCRDWLPASRHHLTSEICITFVNADAFIELLMSPSSTITDHILHLEIRHYEKKNVFGSIVPFLERFGAIRTLRLTMSWSSHQHWRLLKDGQKEIENYRSKVSARFVAMDLTGVSSNMGINYNVELTFSLDPFGNADPFTFLSRVRALYSDSCYEPSLAWLANDIQLPAINDIRLRVIPRHNFNVIRDILLKRGPSIQYLELAFMHLYQATVAELGNANFRSVHIEGIKYPTNIRILNISKINSKISPSSLADIKIEVWAVGRRDMRAGWNELAKVLCHPRFSKLQRVSFDLLCTSSLEQDECEAWVHKEMPSLTHCECLVPFEYVGNM